eukprot:308814-Amphidinium_carterae.1
MVDENFRVVFDRTASGEDASHAMHKPTGTKVPFQRSGKTFDIVMELPSSEEGVLAPLEVEPEVDQALDLDEQVQEEAVPLARRKPKDPTEEEKRQHEVLHEPFRSWCAFCVASRGIADRHSAQERGEDAIASIGLDYAYLDGGDGSDRSGVFPVLVGRDTVTRWCLASLLPCKGTGHPFCVKETVRQVLAAGHTVLELRSDNEPAILDLKTKVAAELRAHKVDVRLTESAVGDSNGNGLAESAVRELKAKCRLLKLQVENLHGCSLSRESNLVPWLVRFAASTMNLGRKGRDGRTPFEIRHGRACKRPLGVFSEKVLFLPDEAGGRASRLEVRWQEGLYLGPRLDTSDNYFATVNGVVRARSFRRLGAADRSARGLVETMVGTPWQPVPGSMDDVIPVKIDAPIPGAVVPPVAAEAPGVPRRVYIRRGVELERFGPMENCPGCRAYTRGLKAVPHSAMCRARISEAMRADRELAGRVIAAEQRAVERRVADAS